MATTNYGLPIITSTMTGDVPRDMNALANATDTALLSVKNTAMAAFTGDITKAAGSTSTAITAGVIVNADVNAAANIDASKIGTGVVSNAEFNYLDGVTSAIQTQITSKQSISEKGAVNGYAPLDANGFLPATYSGAITGDITSAAGSSVSAITAGVIVNADVNAAANIDATKIGTGIVSTTEFNYLDGVTSSIQTQIAAKLPTASYTAADVLAKLLTVDGAGSLVDADTLDTYHAADFPKQTTAALTYYVRTDGNDANTGLANTAGGALKTIQAAIWKLPRIVNSLVIINVAAGTYAEDVIIAGFSGSGVIQIVGDTVLSSTRSIQSLNLSSNALRTEVYGVATTKTTTAGFTVSGCINAYLARCVCITASSFQGFYIEEGNCHMAECQASNRLAGVYAHVNGKVLVQNMTGSGNNVGYSASYGGQISVGASTITATSLYTTFYGGVIFGNDVGGAVNPWGDSTRGTRSGVFYYTNATQPLTANVSAKVLFQNSLFPDALSEFSSSRFTAKGGIGLYSISGIMGWQSGISSTTTSIEIFLFKNGALHLNLGRVSGFTLNNPQVPYCATVELYPGEYIEMYALTSTASVLNSNITTFSVVRIA
ncbi:hypothetical protein H1230_13415 [Paenibacillus sp. 19GGS1-52]|uniref:hypothetical protein n=1 Tax=Paenibacillus sp. 19GGS1-52 TaxID=2758563 RepID=UPI001EFBB16F|nr:hypothetical protein [Paenibacillus sp. 19GGS1-52]ULO09679.1 hypothetical protein H1230_13415 [Paenibacillus sp. 19GGS1-52]